MTDPIDNLFEHFPIIETSKLVLRNITLEDIPAILTIFSDEEVTRYNDIDPFETEERAEWFVGLCHMRYVDKTGIRWGIVRRDDDSDTVIGTCGYNVFYRHSRRAVIGYELARPYWQQGIMTEAVGTIVSFGFEDLDLNRIEAETTLYNVASMRLLSRLGFYEEGVLRDFGYWKGDYHDLRMFSLLRRDYERLDPLDV
ncbi:MAG: GNAT family N-acetyltransferase [Chloroflexi bacterium]|nr:GNAT family N-acetyltransferase [Chloroflexota bacterium]